MWYVIQVINGREDIMRERIEHVLPTGAMQELFYPQFQTEIKVHGEWVNTTKPLFPGYLICDTADPRTVQQYLLRMDDFARVLSQDGQFVPLAKEEVQLISSFTHRGDRVVPMSEALKDGDQVVVTAGPLLGHEGLIKTINRRKSTAYLELDLCGRRVTTRVGLAVLSAEQRVMRNLKKAGIEKTKQECIDIIESLKCGYPKLAEWQKNTKQDASNCGYSETAFGRRRILKGINSPDMGMRSYWQRCALNTPIQGTAADILKLAMIRILSKLEEYPYIKPLLTIHDEILFEVPRNKVDEACTIIKDCMEQQPFPEFDVSLKAEGAKGCSFGNMED